jgi:hypothetical protein
MSRGDELDGNRQFGTFLRPLHCQVVMARRVVVGKNDDHDSNSRNGQDD